jgi:thiol-disulfide isomerase/thioredoxin
VIQRAFVGGPAQAAGLTRGDVIVRAGGAPVSEYKDYITEARKVQIGGTMTLSVLRDGKPIDVELTMMAKPDPMKAWRHRKFPGTPAFAWDVEGLRPSGRRLSSAQADGRPQVMYFWATWCGPCRQTSPQFQAAFEELGDKIQFVAISNEELDVLRRHTERSNKTYPSGRDDTGYAKWDYEIQSLPTAILIHDGQILAWDYGVPGIPRILERSRALVAP